MATIIQHHISIVNCYDINSKMNTMSIIYTTEQWTDSQLSVARYYGGITVKGIHYTLVNKEGKDLFQCTKEADQAGRQYAIEPGEPCDLIDDRYLKKYKELGREDFIQWIKEARL